MIDRKALWIPILLCLAMTAAAVWRLSLLPDWTQMPMLTPKGVVIKNGLVLFIQPFGLLLTIAIVAAPKWLSSGPPNEALIAWYRRLRLLPMAVSAFVALMQVVVISRSLGHDLGLGERAVEAIPRTLMAVLGILIMMQGNALPKLPMLSKRFNAPNPDTWRIARFERFAGWMAVTFGLALIVAAALLPLRVSAPACGIFALALCGGLIWHFVKLKREPSPLP